MKLHSIAEAKDENTEERNAGKSFWDLPEDQLPPCLAERGAFMSPHKMTKVHRHPYAGPYTKTHSHFAPTKMVFPAWSAPGVPFRWMRTDADNVAWVQSRRPDLATDPEREPDLGFKTGWWQDHMNHRALLEAFWGSVRVEESLVFFYCKQTPLVEEAGGKRTIVGVARVKAITPLQEYDYTEKGALRSMLWERHVSHSLRTGGGGDGFLMPYHAALAHAEMDPTFDPSSVVAFAPDEAWDQFSFATEHVTADNTIASLLACAEALRKAKDHLPGDHDAALRWIDTELGRLWKLRGAFPGLGAVLTGMGLPLGNFIAHVIADKAGELGDPWPLVDTMFEKPAKLLPTHLAKEVPAALCKTWRSLSATRRAVHELLARFDLDQDLAATLLSPELRENEGIGFSDDELLANPYILYQDTRLLPQSVTATTVDRGVLPSAPLSALFPLAEPSVLDGNVDERRVTAFIVRLLEDAAAVEGHTLLPEGEVVLRMRPLPIDPPCPLTGDLLGSMIDGEYFTSEITITELADGSRALQLNRLAEVRELIFDTIEKRVKKGKRHVVKLDWRTLLDASLPRLKPGDAAETRAREEKTAALCELAESRLSVLTGPAGTGKTTLLAILCKQPAVRSGGVLLLAPTGKARVRMETKACDEGLTDGFSAQTIAKHLKSSGRYDGSTGRYYLLGETDISPAKTVIIDECSMLTEEMFAATLESLKGVERLILVGDPMQLPPIGAGRPFADIVHRLAPENAEAIFPCVAPGFAELTVLCRHQGERADVQLASWFAGRPVAAGEDDVFGILSGQKQSEHLRVVTWHTPEELDGLLEQVLREELKLPMGDDGVRAFDLKLGAVPFGDYLYFNYGKNAEAAESWQILSPVRQKRWGVDELNQEVHRVFRAKELKAARLPKKWRRKPEPHGGQQIVYGDKVINVRNGDRNGKYEVWPKENALGYLANGEIGRVVGEFAKSGAAAPWQLHVNFASQPAHRYIFTASKDFPDGEAATLELAYALTVHKAQGSEFGLVVLVLPKSTLHLSREMLYTALTRQRDRVVLFCQDSPLALQSLSHPRYSATARRLTNLFRAPHLVKLEGGAFLEHNLIHQTARGEAVRSKSEVIVADALHHRRLAYEYERPLTLGGITRYPDFTIVDDDLGQTFYWEHLGMLWNTGYSKRWKEKLAWYHANGINETGGPNGTLITSLDDERGGISSALIRSKIQEAFGN